MYFLRLIELCLTVAALSVASAFAAPIEEQTWQYTLNSDGRGGIKKIIPLDENDFIAVGYSSTYEQGSEGLVARLSYSGETEWVQTLGGSLRDEFFDVQIIGGRIFVLGWRDVMRGTSNAFIASYSLEGELIWSNTIDRKPLSTLPTTMLPLPDGAVWIALKQDIRNRLKSSNLTKLDKLGVEVGSYELLDMQQRKPSDLGETDQILITPTAGIIQRIGRIRKIYRSGSKVIAELYTTEMPLKVRRACQSVGPVLGLVEHTTCPDHDELPLHGKWLATSAVTDQTKRHKIDVPAAFGAGHRAYVSQRWSDVDGGTLLIGGLLLSKARDPEACDAFIIRTDSEGEILWKQRYGGSKRDSFMSVLPLPEGGFIVGGETGSQGGYGWQPWLLRLDNTGRLQKNGRLEMLDLQR